MRDKVPNSVASSVGTWDDPTDSYPTCTYAFRTQAGSKGGGIDGVRVPVEDTQFAFSGGKAELAIRFNDHVVQTINWSSRGRAIGRSRSP
jgi:hypothetical protein